MASRVVLALLALVALCLVVDTVSAKGIMITKGKAAPAPTMTKKCDDVCDDECTTDKVCKKVPYEDCKDVPKETETKVCTKVCGSVGKGRKLAGKGKFIVFTKAAPKCEDKCEMKKTTTMEKVCEKKEKEECEDKKTCKKVCKKVCKDVPAPSKGKGMTIMVTKSKGL